MSDLQGSNSAIKAHPIAAAGKSIHQVRVTNVIPAAIKNASRATLESMLNEQARMPDWYMKTSSADRRLLKSLLDERWRLQGELDGVLVDLQHDIEAFARPLLANAVKATFSHLGDPETLSLQLYVPDTIIFGLDTGASRLRRSSLLAAALHNFEEPETHEGAFRSGSGVFRNDAQGSPQRIAAITPEKLAKMCRTLDIGGQYQRHIQAQLQPQAPKAERALQARSVACEKAAFGVAALIAHLKGEVSAAAYGNLQDIVEGTDTPTLQGRALLKHRLSLLGFKLTGIVLFSAVSEPSEIKKLIEDLTPQGLKFWLEWSRRIPGLSGNPYEKYKLLQNFFANGPQGVIEDALHKEDIYNQSRLDGALIAYIPDDPECPLKEYASLADFMTSLLSRLRTSDYQEFFSRFVDQKDKGSFFTRVNERLKTVTWHQREPLDIGPGGAKPQSKIRTPSPSLT